ncbi:MAG: 3-oxoacyl-[acyl-carrier-protein] reductase [Oscillospiraceae bacterium]|nr:3-oxoacyl-[acyl-carrier-protein] reductase [Oscillospiraceae bacterium]
MLNGKTALITGASRGIGRAIALKLSNEGASIAAIYCGSEEKARELKAEIDKNGGKINIYKCDVSNFSECENIVKQVISDFGGVDILVNNAGITNDKLVLQMGENDFDSVIDTNLKGAFNMIKHCYRNFMKKKYGKIINISSVSGIIGNAGQANYSSAKAGIIGLTKTVAKELASRNVCCNAIAPGFIKTDMTESFQDNENVLSSIPLKRMGSADEVANLAAFLASDLSDYITGEVIRIDGGLAM